MRGEFVDLGGVRLYYYAAGTRGAGDPIVLIHGFPTSGHLWAEVVPLLPGGHRVVVVDLLGYGRSDRPRDAAVTVRAHADRIVALLDVLGIGRACVVGHDVGGGIAQSIASRYAGRVSSLGLINSVAFDQWPYPRGRLARRLLPIVEHCPPSWVVSILRRGLMRGYADHERGAHSVAHYIRAFAGTEGLAALVRHIADLNVPDASPISGLRRVECPTAIVVGEHDPFIPRDAADSLQNTLPGATVDVIRDGRHFTPEEAPVRIGAALADLLRR